MYLIEVVEKMTDEWALNNKAVTVLPGYLVFLQEHHGDKKSCLLSRYALGSDCAGQSALI